MRMEFIIVTTMTTGDEMNCIQIHDVSLAPGSISVPECYFIKMMHLFLGIQEDLSVFFHDE